ncbi:hypothetical protein NEAUS04_1627 [Nematocida ausubeli]|uniref:B box-type domain-containing protein n=2 Tax=Nematocida ausubeli (strain ATCC PRA-371 / ERTm2) TaxID=1913371 RepID=A0A086J1W6_NEMA1|nr:uncharacterized protein NESG_01249 [Nematocida ausubeli]KAI5163516.1 hypothetical protein NEAUS04_1627 [Nematocida ausubeli]KFG26134.1 hypothetical protein NESG_01249 [Nematocida ausubeli]
MEDIEYKLRFLMNSMTLTVNSVKYAESAKNQLEFIKKFKNQKIIHCFIKDSQLPIITPLMGLPINQNETKHKLLFCQIAVGTPLFSSSEYAMNCKTPHGYDSFLISSSQEPIETVIKNFKKLSKTTNTLSSYSYVVPDINRVLILGEVDFTYDIQLENHYKNNELCENCNTSNSVTFCLAERAAFCSDCDKLFHNNNFTQRHSRFYFNEIGKKRFINCKYHSSTVIDYFCTDCSVPLCTNCRINDNLHQNHNLITYIQACDDLKTKISQDPEMEIVLKRTNSLITEIEQEITQFEQEITKTKMKLQYEYDTCMNTLNDLVKRRYQNINSKYFECKYLTEMAVRGKTYPNEIDASVLVEKWKVISDVNKNISNIVLPDKVIFNEITVKGSLSVECASDNSGSVVSARQEDDLVRKRTEMLLRVSQFKTNE